MKTLIIIAALCCITLAARPVDSWKTSVLVQESNLMERNTFAVRTAPEGVELSVEGDYINATTLVPATRVRALIKALEEKVSYWDLQSALKRKDIKSKYIYSVRHDKPNGATGLTVVYFSMQHGLDGRVMLCVIDDHNGAFRRSAVMRMGEIPRLIAALKETI